MTTSKSTTLTHEDLDVPGLCKDARGKLRFLIGDGPFSPREAATAYIAAGPWQDIPRAYQALVRAGRLPETGLIWRIARIAFREASTLDRLRHLAPWAETLGPDNWRAAAADAYAAAAAANAAANAAAYAAANAAADADANAAAYAAAYAAANAAAGNRVRDEIVAMVLDEVERVLRGQEVA